MPRIVKVDSWGVTWEEYKELSYFCLQYDRKKKEAAALLTIRISTPEPEVYYTQRKITLADGREHTMRIRHGVYQPRGSGQTSDPVAATAAKRDRLLRDVRMIEQAAQEAVRNTDLKAVYMVKAVTQRGGISALYKDISNGPLVSEREFKKLRRKFFWILREMRNGDIEAINSDG